MSWRNPKQNVSYSQETSEAKGQLGISKIYVAKVGLEPEIAMSEIFSKLGLPENAQNICIKLNLCDYRRRETGATSDPFIVESLLIVLRKKYPYSNISLVENDASGVSADNIFGFLGFDVIAKKYNCNIVNLARENWIKKKIAGSHFRFVSVPEILDKCDLFITHPKLKTHGLTKITCSLKNQFGCLKPKPKIIFHKYLDEAIVDANIAMHPDLSIVDANICMEGLSGPTYGIPKKVGLLICSSDVVATDAFCAKLMGFRPYFVGHIRKAARKRVGSLKYSVDWLNNSEKHSLKQYKFDFNRPLYYTMKLVKRKMR